MGVLSSNITTPRRPPAPLPPLSKSRPRSPPFWHRLCSRLGFQKTHNFVLFVLLGLVGVLGQGVLHSPKLDYFNVFCRRGHLAKGLHAAPGECYYFRNGGREQVGMMLHVYAVVPVCFLLVLQFVPAARQRQHRRRGGGGGGRGGGGGALLHRVSGYAVLLLTSLAMGGGWLASAGSFGGAGPWRALVWVLGGMVLCGLARAMRAIWRGKVELHRAWMLRTWAWAFSSITMRLLQQIGAHLISPSSSSSSSSFSSFFLSYHRVHHYTSLRPCAQIASDGVLPEPAITTLWPACAAYFSGDGPNREVLVGADYAGTPIEAHVALSMAAGPAGWAALVLHVLVVEVYLHLTHAASSETQQRSQQNSHHLNNKKVAANTDVMATRRQQQHEHAGSSTGLTTSDDHLGESPEWILTRHDHNHDHDDGLDIGGGGGGGGKLESCGSLDGEGGGFVVVENGIDRGWKI